MFANWYGDKGEYGLSWEAASDFSCASSASYSSHERWVLLLGPSCAWILFHKKKRCIETYRSQRNRKTVLDPLLKFIITFSLFFGFHKFGVTLNQLTTAPLPGWHCSHILVGLVHHHWNGTLARKSCEKSQLQRWLRCWTGKLMDRSGPISSSREPTRTNISNQFLDVSCWNDWKNLCENKHQVNLKGIGLRDPKSYQNHIMCCFPMLSIPH